MSREGGSAGINGERNQWGFSGTRIANNETPSNGKFPILFPISLGIFYGSGVGITFDWDQWVISYPKNPKTPLLQRFKPLPLEGPLILRVLVNGVYWGYNPLNNLLLTSKATSKCFLFL